MGATVYRFCQYGPLVWGRNAAGNRSLTAAKPHASGTASHVGGYHSILRHWRLRMRIGSLNKYVSSTTASHTVSDTKVGE